MVTGTASNDCSPANTYSAEVIAGDEDLLTEILLLLPVKPLIRFKSVSKRWLSLISGPHFSQRHTRRNPSSISGIFFRRTTDLVDAEFEFVSLDDKLSRAPFRSLNFVHDPVGIKILQSCNGLLCCCSSRKNENTRNYYIYNPTTHQFLTLPSPNGMIFGVNLAFDPSKSPYYKVVCVRSSASSIYHYQIEIYSSENGLWKLSGDSFTAQFEMVFDNGVFWNGAIHWISPTGASLKFRIDEESLGKMPSLPFTESWGKRRYRHFAESRGHLHLIEVYGSRTTQFKVFEMATDNSEWFVKYHVDLNPITAAFPEMIGFYLDPCDLNYVAFFIIFLNREENDEESSLLLHIPGKIISYKFKDKTFKKVCDLIPSTTDKRSSLQFGWLDAYQYIESLSCVDVISSHSLLC